MRSVCLYFQVHQPSRLRTYRFFDIGGNHYYFDDFLNKSIVRRVAEKCYLPANDIIYKLIKEYGSGFKVAYSITGTALEQFEKYAPKVIESFQKLAATGNVEFLAETYSHSLAALKNKDEFGRQVRQHSEVIQKLFNQTPKVFRNTELVYSNNIGDLVYELGYKTMITEGAKQVLGWKSPNFLYSSMQNPGLKLLLRNYQLSDDITFRFSQRSWSEWPLTADKFFDWINSIDKKQEVVNLFMDYETFGEHQKADQGIFNFLYYFPGKLIKSGKWRFLTPSEVSDSLQPVAGLNIPYTVSWADEERDLTAWIGNDLQNDAFDRLYSVADTMSQCTDQLLLSDWNSLQNSDHFYYMCTKWFSDGAVHHYFNPFNSPYEAYLNYMNALADFLIRVKDYSLSMPEQNPVINEVKPKATSTQKISPPAKIKKSPKKTVVASKTRSKKDVEVLPVVNKTKTVKKKIK